jgi:AcrR family transcriptional regulator
MPLPAVSLVDSLRALAVPMRPRKGDATRAAIVEAALAVARRDGLEGLTIGALAEQLDMSKSGVFAHFGSREELQLAVLHAYAARFVDSVLRPALGQPRGLPRLAALLSNWLDALGRELEQGCLMIAGASEYDDREGSLHDAMVRIVAGWKSELLRALSIAADEGHLARGTDAEQLVFEIYGLMLVAHQDARLLRSRDSLTRARAGLARLLDSVSTPIGRRALQASPSAPRTPRPKAVAKAQPSRATRARGARSLPSNQGRAPGRPQPDPQTEAERVHVHGKAAPARATNSTEAKRVHLRPAGARARASKQPARTRATKD